MAVGVAHVDSPFASALRLAAGASVILIEMRSRQRNLRFANFSLALRNGAGKIGSALKTPSIAEPLTRRGMMKTLRLRGALLVLAAVVVASGPAFGADSVLDSLKKGNPELKSAGVLTFGPEGVLFVADPQA